MFSAIGHNHVGIVIAVKDNTLTVQEGNLDGITNTFQDAKKGLANKILYVRSIKIYIWWSGVCQS